MEGPKNMKKCLRGYIKQGCPRCIERYINLGGDLNKVLHKTTFLCEASRKGSVEAVKMILDAGADVNITGANGSSPLNIAALRGELDIVKLLTLNGANVNQESQIGVSPLVSALQNSHNDCAKVLIENGACVNAERPSNVFGARVSLLIYVLFAKGDWDMAETLLTAGIKPTSFSAPLGFILLDDPNTPVGLIRKLVYSGFNVPVEGWMDLSLRKGNHITSTQRELVDILEEHKKSALSLQRICRNVVRMSLIQNNTTPCMHLSKKIDQLYLPREVKKYLNLEYI